MSPPTGRFGERPRPRTVQTIERVIEWVEAQTAPFTVSDAHKAVGGTPSVWSTTYLTMRELRDKGLVKRVSPPRTKPALWIRVDTPNPETTVDLED